MGTAIRKAKEEIFNGATKTERCGDQMGSREEEVEDTNPYSEMGKKTKGKRLGTSVNAN